MARERAYVGPFDRICLGLRGANVPPQLQTRKKFGAQFSRFEDGSEAGTHR